MALAKSRRSQLEKFQHVEDASNEICRLDRLGHAWPCPSMVEVYKRRNSFGLDRSIKLHRIFRTHFLDRDIKDRSLTLPKACASVWNDDLENPLSGVVDHDAVTGGHVDLGNLVRNFYALCWTTRAEATETDWRNFSHGHPATRVTTTVGKLMDAVFLENDPHCMHRVWLVDVDYKDPKQIESMQNPGEVYRHLESTGALLALSAATVRTEYSDEDEVRLLYDTSLALPTSGVSVLAAPDRLRILCDVKALIEHRVDRS